MLDKEIEGEENRSKATYLKLKFQISRVRTERVHNRTLFRFKSIEIFDLPVINIETYQYQIVIFAYNNKMNSMTGSVLIDFQNMPGS